MKERITALMAQAKFVAEECINRQISQNQELEAFAGAFAALLFKECIEQVENTDLSNTDINDVQWKMSTQLSTYFGVNK